MRVSGINLITFKPNVIPQKSLKAQFAFMPTFKEDAPTTDKFSMGNSELQKVITVEDIRNAGENFLNGTQDDNSVENVEKLYKQYSKTFLDYCEQGNFRVLRHQFANEINEKFWRSLQTSTNENKGIDYKKMESIIAGSNKLIYVYQLFCQNGAETGDLVKIFDIQTVFKTALKLARENAEEKGINIIVQNEKLLDEIEQGSFQFDNYIIFSNIIGNAIKYSPEDSTIKIKIKKEKNEYIYRDGRHSGKFDTHYYFIVEDEGIGIPEKDLESVLDGKRGSNVEDIYGTGQGLKEILNIYGKKEITITSPIREGPYKGTRVKVKLRGWEKYSTY